MKEITVFAVLYGVLPLLIYKIKNISLKPVEPFIWVVFIASLYEFFGTYILKFNATYWLQVYKILAFVSIHYFFYKLLKSKYLLLFKFFIVAFLMLQLFCFLKRDSIDFLDINAYFNLLQTIIVIVFSVLWFRSIFLNLELDSFTKSPMFYFVSGLILYYSGTVFLFLLSNFIFTMDKSNFQSFWMLNIFLNFVLRTLLIIGVWKGKVK